MNTRSKKIISLIRSDIKTKDVNNHSIRNSVSAKASVPTNHIIHPKITDRRQNLKKKISITLDEEVQFKIDKFISNLSKDDENIALDSFSKNCINTNTEFEDLNQNVFIDQVDNKEYIALGSFKENSLGNQNTEIEVLNQNVYIDQAGNTDNFALGSFNENCVNKKTKSDDLNQNVFIDQVDNTEYIALGSFKENCKDNKNTEIEVLNQNVYIDQAGNTDNFALGSFNENCVNKKTKSDDLNQKVFIDQVDNTEYIALGSFKENSIGNQNTGFEVLNQNVYIDQAGNTDNIALGSFNGNCVNKKTEFEDLNQNVNDSAFDNDKTLAYSKRYENVHSKMFFELNTLPEIVSHSELESSLSEYDSGDEYRPPQSFEENSSDSDEVISFKSDINVKSVSNDCYSNSLQPSSSLDVVKENQTILSNVLTHTSKNKKTGYDFSGVVETSKKSQINNKRCWNKTDCCIYCEKNITNFTRHISRNHSNEIDVIRYNALPKGSKERQILADELRKRGNFLSNVGADHPIKPVRRPNEFSKIPSNACDYLPCKHCYGLFKKNYLSRHEKLCKSVKTKQIGRNKAQSDSQNLLLTFSENDSQLIKEVFPRMAADNISRIAKTDHLIKSFGSRYLKCHREKHLINVVSQKMRLLARLLIQVKLKEPSVRNLYDCLNPKYFDSIVKCTKEVAGYSISDDKFGSPSVILKIGSALKQCCDIAEFQILKGSINLVSKDENFISRESFINMRLIIDKQWSYELSTNASKELYQAKWNKPSYLPLTSDIKLFRDHLIKVQVNCIKDLKNDPNNLKSYRELQESILAQLVLLNRRRSGEVQRILLETYISSPSELSLEEVELSLSVIEQQLTKQFKRILVRGKRGRGVPVLFTPNIQKVIKFLLQIRNVANFIEKENPFLFALPFSMSCLRGSDAIRKFSNECGAKNPQHITSTRLRKQVATVAQILNLSEGDIEQLSTFLGHTKDVHKSFYRLSESTFQIAKISKLLLMMEKGQGHEYRGKNLDEIDISVDTLVSDEENFSNDDDDDDDDNMPINNDQQTPLITSSVKKTDNEQNIKDIEDIPPKKKMCRSKNKKGKTISNVTKNVKNAKPKFNRVPWTAEQKNITKHFFQKHILLKKAPKKEECEEMKKKYSRLFNDLPWKKIKTFVHNAYNKP